MNPKIVRITKQPPNVGHFIENRIGFVEEEQETGGITWLHITTLSLEGKSTGSGWVAERWVEPVKDPAWEEAYAKYALFMTNLENEIMERTKKHIRKVEALAQKYNLSVQAIEDLHREYTENE